jgi:hypothetical protein
MLTHSLALARRVNPALAATLLSAVLLAGCSGGVEGTYVSTEKDSDGTFEMALKLDDGKATMTMSGTGGGSMTSPEGTYKVDGDQVTITIDGDAQVFTLKGGKLTGRVMGEDLTLSKR